MREKRRKKGIKGKEERKKDRKEKGRKKERREEKKEERKEKKEEWKGGWSVLLPEVAGDGRRWLEMGGQSPKPNQWWCKCSLNGENGVLKTRLRRKKL